MLRFPLIHPPLLAALGAAGHGARVLLAAVPVEAVTVMRPDEGGPPEVWDRYRTWRVFGHR